MEVLIILILQCGTINYFQGNFDHANHNLYKHTTFRLVISVPEFLPVEILFEGHI